MRHPPASAGRAGAQLLRRPTAAAPAASPALAAAASLVRPYSSALASSPSSLSSSSSSSARLPLVSRPTGLARRTAESRRGVHIPYVEDETRRGGYQTDIFSRLLKERVLSVGPVNDTMSTLIVASLLYLEAIDPKKPIMMYINSPGGVVSSGLAIYDTMQYISSPVHTFCMGQAASMGSLLLAGGAKGHRSCLPRSRVMIHQPSGGASGKASDLAIRAEEILKTRERLTEIYAAHCRVPKADGTLESVDECKERYERALERDFFLDPEQALEFGLIDKVVQSRKKDGGKAAEGEASAEDEP